MKIFLLVSENHGDLTYYEVMRDIPFVIKRVFLICNVPDTQITRANHASIVHHLCCM